MGQEQSVEEAAVQTPEQLSTLLAHRFAETCFGPLELAHFKDNFRTLADRQDGLAYWKESTLTRFLALPDSLAVGPVIFQMASYLGAFPYPSLAPAILTREALCKAVVLLTGRHERALKRGSRNRLRLLFRSLAVYDRRASIVLSTHGDDYVSEEKKQLDSAIESLQNDGMGFDIDRPVDEEDESDDEDALALAALESLDAIAAFPSAEPPRAVKMLQAQIPRDNLRSIIMFLLLIATLESQANLERMADILLQSRMRAIQEAADAILCPFAPEETPVVPWATFKRIVTNSLPFMFEALNPLFEHFLYSKNMDLHKRALHRRNSSVVSTKFVSSPRIPGDLPSSAVTDPILPQETDLLDLTTLSQLSFFIKSSEIFRHVRLLYAGGDSGFSIQSITHKILNWRAPTILLVSGTRLPAEPSTPRERAFAATLPPRRYSSSASGNTHASGSSQTSTTDSNNTRVVFGAYLSQPWRQTTKTALTDANSLLFQLAPLHDVFRPSSLDTSHFTLSSTGLGIGCPLNTSNPAVAAHRSGSNALPAELGAVSLWLDANLEFGVFTHTSAGGGAFAPSVAQRGDWQDRFEIDSLEVWGCGGDEEAARQRLAWAWEEREAEMRRTIKVGKGDRDADYALLEMAGLVGGAGNSGGSMG